MSVCVCVFLCRIICFKVFVALIWYTNSSKCSVLSPYLILYNDFASSCVCETSFTKIKFTLDYAHALKHTHTLTRKRFQFWLVKLLLILLLSIFHKRFGRVCVLQSNSGQSRNPDTHADSKQKEELAIVLLMRTHMHCVD